jgi:hypothetical protein
VGALPRATLAQGEEGNRSPSLPSMLPAASPLSPWSGVPAAGPPPPSYPSSVLPLRRAVLPKDAGGDTQDGSREAIRGVGPQAGTHAGKTADW